MSFPLLVTGELSSIPGIPQQQTASILQAFQTRLQAKRFSVSGFCLKEFVNGPPWRLFRTISLEGA